MLLNPRSMPNTLPPSFSASPASTAQPVHQRLRCWLAAVILLLFCVTGSIAAPKNLTTTAWDDLPAAVKSSLQPLQDAWQNLSPADRAKWLKLSAGYPDLPQAQQKRLHERMLEWVEMSPDQRNRAREAFLKSQSELATAERKAQWEAYQALSAEEKKRLSKQAEQKKQKKTSGSK